MQGFSSVQKPPEQGGYGYKPLPFPFLFRALALHGAGGWGSEPPPFPFLFRALVLHGAGGWRSEPLPFSLRSLYSCTRLLSKYPDNGLWAVGLCPYLFNDRQPAFLFFRTVGQSYSPLYKRQRWWSLPWLPPPFPKHAYGLYTAGAGPFSLPFFTFFIRKLCKNLRKSCRLYIFVG